MALYGLGKYQIKFEGDRSRNASFQKTFHN